MEFRLLGPLEVVGGGRDVRLGGTRLPALLATLLLHANQRVGHELLARVLWTQPPRAVGSNIRTYVAQLRARLVGAGEAASRLVTSGGGYRLEVRPGELDLAVFDGLVADGQRALERADRDAALDRLRRALDLWRGEPLTGVTGGPQLGVEAARLEERRADVAERWAELALATGRPEEAAVELGRVVPAHPLREQLWIQLMTALYRSGRQAAALAAYREAYRLLDQELGIRPGRPLQQLHQQILAADPALDRPYRRAAALASAPPRPRQLPPDLAAFAGRAEGLAALDALVGRREGDRPGVVTVAVVGGTPGVGKTTLALHWAHRVAHLFPDGQLHANLRGVRSTDVVRGFLDALGVPAERIPAGPDGPAGLYRSLLADRRVLVVLDDAADAEQVRPLLPGGAGCLVVVTGRYRLSSLVASAGAQPVHLDLPSAAEARDLLARRLGATRVAAEPAAVDEVVARCGRLPLALSIVAARAVAHPDRPLAALAAELRRAHGSLDAFGDADPAVDLRSVFARSYHALGPAAGRLFQALGSRPVPTSSVTEAAGLAGVAVPVARTLLTELADAHLVSERGPDRYAMHALLRAYASELPPPPPPR